jgi:hypothetical protein
VKKGGEKGIMILTHVQKFTKIKARQTKNLIQTTEKAKYEHHNTRRKRKEKAYSRIL